MKAWIVEYLHPGIHDWVFGHFGSFELAQTEQTLRSRVDNFRFKEMWRTKQIETRYALYDDEDFVCPLPEKYISAPFLYKIKRFEP